jgi:hypothetical protein
MNPLIYDIFGLYMANFDDYISSLLCLQYSAKVNGKLKEANTVINLVGKTWYSFALYKFGLATLLIFVILMFFPFLKMFIFVDTVLETAVSLHNIKMLYNEKRSKVS